MNMAKPVARRAFLLRAGTSALALGSAALLAACGDTTPPTKVQTTATGQASTPPAEATGVLRVGNASEPNFLDPTRSLTASELGIERAIYEGLVQWSPDYKEVVPQLATSWTVNADATEFTFELAPGRRFSDGTPVTSAAIRDSFAFWQRPGSGLGLLLPQMKQVDVSDPLRLRVVAKAPAPDFIRNLPFIMIISPKLVAKGADAVNKTPVGSGPYQLKRWDRGRALTLVPTPGRSEAHFTSIEFRPIPQASARLTALSAGEVDVIMGVDPTAVGRFANNKQYEVYSNLTWAKTSLFLKVTQKPLDDPRVRQAMAYAIDREGIASALFKGAVKVNDGFQVPGTYGYHSPATTYPHDPERARQLLQAAGVERPKVSIAYVATGGIDDRAVDAIAGQLTDAGFVAEAKGLEPGLFNQELLAKKQRFNVYVATSGWVNGGPFHWIINNIGSNTAYGPPAYLELIKRISTTPDGRDRLRAIADVEEMVAKDVPVVPLWQRTEQEIATAKLDGFDAPIDGFVPRLTHSYFGD